MNYYIVGKKINEGIIGNDGNGILSNYFELGWEYVVTHLYIKHLFNTNKLKPTDCIVTIKDRMFLYTGFWKNVISYEEFITTEKKGNVIDLCDISYDILPKIVGDKYEYFDDDLPVIKNVDYINVDHLPTDSEYCCLHLRYRDWAPFRNLDLSYWLKIIDKLTKKGLKIFIFGKSNENLCDNKNTFCVNLDEYASLLNNKNCSFLIGTVSGGSLTAQLFSHKNCVNNIIITDTQTETEILKTTDEFKAFHHIPEFNFSGTKINFIKLSELDNFIKNL